MCGKYATFMYKDDKSTMKSLFPEIDWKEQFVCDGCARRECGKKSWVKVKRK